MANAAKQCWIHCCHLWPRKEHHHLETTWYNASKHVLGWWMVVHPDASGMGAIRVVKSSISHWKAFRRPGSTWSFRHPSLRNGWWSTRATYPGGSLWFAAAKARQKSLLTKRRTPHICIVTLCNFKWKNHSEIPGYAMKIHEEMMEHENPIQHLMNPWKWGWTSWKSDGSLPSTQHFLSSRPITRSKQCRFLKDECRLYMHHYASIQYNVSINIYI